MVLRVGAKALADHLGHDVVALLLKIADASSKTIAVELIHRDGTCDSVTFLEVSKNLFALRFWHITF